MSKVKTTVVVAVLALVLAGTALGSSFSKRTLSDARVGKSKSELQAQIDYSQKVERFFGHHHWMIAARHSTCWSHVPWAKTCNRARIIERRHEFLYALATKLMTKLYPSHPIVTGNGGEFECIHLHEGAWNANTGNGFYGGLQEDRRFQSQYGAEFVARWGTADNWPMWAQVVAARRARDGYGNYKARGYSPWPNTARACGQL